MRMMIARSGVLGLALCLAAGTAVAEEMNYSAELTGDAQVPPVETEASGTMDATYDTETMELSWTTEHSGLSGEPTAAHFHGPAGPDETAPPMIPIELDMLGEGSATLTQEQADALADGMLYVNIHTQAHPDGEIRGQVMQAE